MSGLVTAIAYLTRLPVPSVTPFRLDHAAPWFPLVGALLGSIIAAADLTLGWWSRGLTPLASTVDVVLLLALSGALHADGLMDTCDAVFSHASPQRRLEIMRDPRVGAFGVVGLVGLVLLKIAALGVVASPARFGLLVLGPCVGRWCLLLAAMAFPYGRPGGSGEPVKAAATGPAVALAAVVPLSLAAAIGWAGAIAFVVATLFTLGLGRWLSGLLPGLTGDCYGAVCEVSEAVVWLSAALVLTRLG